MKKQPSKRKKAFGDSRSAYYQDGSALVYDEDGGMTLTEARAAYIIGKPAKIFSFEAPTKK